ncbi:AUGMIN subunit 7 [Camellia lanceoleosa]|uniref:AUGMIN subunit 7 n=1 Tax=Camellia lanceoleosa TaxID=1840588 RepID=A0ACC0IK36_9ERIC|nr:AUGMIN subunit 7 [Camellia lanceoleosa]
MMMIAESIDRVTSIISSLLFDCVSEIKDEDYVEVEAKLRGHLESFLEIVRSFNMIYTKEICPWTHMMVGSQLHGFRPAANRLLDAYKMLLKDHQWLKLFHTRLSIHWDWSVSVGLVCHQWCLLVFCSATNGVGLSFAFFVCNLLYLEYCFVEDFLLLQSSEVCFVEDCSSVASVFYSVFPSVLM